MSTDSHAGDKKIHEVRYYSFNYLVHKSINYHRKMSLIKGKFNDETVNP